MQMKRKTNDKDNTQDKTLYKCKESSKLETELSRLNSPGTSEDCFFFL